MATSAVDDVAAALRNCISGDSAAREAGESRLQQLRSQPGHAQALLHLILSGDRDCPGSAEDTAVRQLASISFKNLVARSWTQSLSSAGAAPPLQIHPEDKTAVRGTLLAGIPIAPPPLRSQLVEALKDIVASDYPQDWPGKETFARSCLIKIVLDYCGVWTMYMCTFTRRRKRASPFLLRSSVPRSLPTPKKK